VDLQELILRGRFLLAEAPERLKVFELVNGRRTVNDIAGLTNRRESNVSKDIARLVDAELLQARINSDGSPARAGASVIYEKVPLARTVPMRFFRGTPARLPAKGKRAPTQGGKLRTSRKVKARSVPEEAELLAIFQSGEDQAFEFKGQGTEARKIAKEAAAMLHSREGGVLFYGIDDDGAIQGTDIARQQLDQSVQNAMRNSVAPQATIHIKTVTVMGAEIVAIVVSPWNGRDVYHYEGRVYIRKGTNVFQATPEEVRGLHEGRTPV
jgi:predicted HTH transcriptional regulator